MPRRRRLATGIYADASGISVIYHAHGEPIETRFEADRPLDVLIRWRKRQIAEAADQPHRVRRSTLTRDVVRVLKRLKGLPGYASEKSHLRAWLHTLGDRPRWTITTEDVALQIAAWRQAGYSARTIRHRCRVLQALYHRLDGPAVPTPVDAAELPRKPKARPIAVSDALIRAVALELYKHERLGLLRDAKTRARFLVLATTGRRPVEVQRTRREDVSLTARTWHTRTAKGGPNNVLALNDEQAAAWQLFAEAGAWGPYDTRSFVRVLHNCGWPTEIRPYNLRHTTAFAVRRRGGDAGHVKEQLGHASIATGAFYFADEPEQQQATSAALEGRLGPLAFLPRSVSTIRPRQHAKVREKASDFTPERSAADQAHRGRKR